MELGAFVIKGQLSEGAALVAEMDVANLPLVTGRVSIIGLQYLASLRIGCFELGHDLVGIIETIGIIVGHRLLAV